MQRKRRPELSCSWLWRCENVTVLEVFERLEGYFTQMSGVAETRPSLLWTLKTGILTSCESNEAPCTSRSSLRSLRPVFVTLKTMVYGSWQYEPSHFENARPTFLGQRGVPSGWSPLNKSLSKFAEIRSCDPCLEWPWYGPYRIGENESGRSGRC